MVLIFTLFLMQLPVLCQGLIYMLKAVCLSESGSVPAISGFVVSRLLIDRLMLFVGENIRKQNVSMKIRPHRWHRVEGVTEI